MSTVRRRLLAATALVATAALTLGGCGTGFGAQTNKVYQAAVGADHRGEMDVLNTLFVVNDDTSATLSAGIINNTQADQSLSSVTVTTLDDKVLPVRSTKLPLPTGVLSTVGGASDTSGFRIAGGAIAGTYVKVTLSFDDSAPVTIQAPVVARTAEYDDVAGNEPAPVATGVNDTAREGAEGVDTE